MLSRFNTIGIKLILTVGAALILILTGGFIFILERMNRMGKEDFIRQLSTITSYAESVRQYLSENQETDPKAGSAYKDIKMIPVIAAWQTAQMQAKGKDYSFETPSLNPRNPDHLPDDFQRRALEAFLRDPGLREYYEETAGGTRLFRYAVPVRLTQDCLLCHGDPKGEPDEFGYPREGMRLGALKGAFTVTAPLSLLEARWRESRWIIFLLGVTILGAITAILLFVVRRITSPLSALLAATRTLGKGETWPGLPVESSDEVGQLAGAFNDMAAKLKASYDGLEEKVEARTYELRRSQAQLLQAAKLASIGELVGGIAHEINNPTGIIVMRAATLADEGRTNSLSEAALNDVEVIQRQADKLARITTGLLQFSRQSPFSPQPVDINRLVRGPISLIEPTLRSRRIACRVLLGDDLPLVSADTTRIEQVLLNLCTNAIDAMPGGGELTIRTDYVKDQAPALRPVPPEGPARRLAFGENGAGEWVVISVKDTGEGIQSENMPRIFDPFFTTKEVGKGTGLGLSISYGIIQEHGGRIEVESRWGNGALFRVYLPAAGSRAGSG